MTKVIIENFGCMGLLLNKVTPILQNPIQPQNNTYKNLYNHEQRL